MKYAALLVTLSLFGCRVQDAPLVPEAKHFDLPPPPIRYGPGTVVIYKPIHLLPSQFLECDHTEIIAGAEMDTMRQRRFWFNTPNL